MTTPPAANALVELGVLLETMRQLRDPKDGCPWDLEQTHASLRPAMLEESYEAMEALGSGDIQAMVEELGDLLIQLVFHGQIGAEGGTFTLADVARQANGKLVRRHPHVFGQDRVATAEEVKRRWDRLKAQEREAKGQGDRSMLDGVPATMPALAYAQAVQDRVSRAGFVWPQGVLSDETLPGLARAMSQEPSLARREEAFGQLLVALVGVARSQGLDAEQALRSANQGFYRRMAWVERACRARGLSMDSLAPEEQAQLWGAGGKAS